MIKKLLATYLAIVVVCFGPATVQSERAAEEYKAQCRAEMRDSALWKVCGFSGPSVIDGFPKAVFWPLWLSYTVASALTPNA